MPTSKHCQTLIGLPHPRQTACPKELVKQLLALFLPLSGRHIGHLGILPIGCCGEGNSAPTGLSASFHGTCGLTAMNLQIASWGFAFLSYIPRVPRALCRVGISDMEIGRLSYRMCQHRLGTPRFLQRFG